MATTARQQYFADEISLQKESREFSLEDNIKQKIDSVEEWAEVNTINTIKVNGTALVPDANKAVNVDVPDVIDNLYSTSTDDALSAKQWKVLYDYLQNIASRWRFLSNWNSATGLPITNPSESPYPYKSWDYFVVSNVAWLWGTNYRPDGSSYIIWQASTVVETEDVSVSDFYFYDGTNWLLLSNSGRQIAIDSSLSTTSTNPVENRVVTNAINWKQDTLIAWSHIDITSNVVSTTGLQEELTPWDNITIWDVCTTESDMKWPCPSGYHIPTKSEWSNIYGVLVTTFGLTNNKTTLMTYLKMPDSWMRRYDTAIRNDWSRVCAWSSVANSTIYSSALSGRTNEIVTDLNSSRAYAYPIRPFKNTPVVPDSSWNTLYDGSSVATNAWIFHNSTEWLISLSWNWTTWYTMQDKNLWATTVYNSWDTLSETNCWWYFQRGNNYMFPWIWNPATITTSSTTIDASTYWPWNYYNSSTFITTSGSSQTRETSWNTNLRWWTSQWTWQDVTHNVISATDTIYTAWNNIQISAQNVISATDTTYTATDFDIKDLTDSTGLRTTWSWKQDAFFTSSSTVPSNPSEWDLWYDTVNDELKVYDGTQWNTTGWWGSWDVVWPASATDWHLAVFDWATGKLIKDWGAIPAWVPSAWTEGQVLTVVSWAAAWANASGWDVVVSSQPNNILTSWMKIWAWEETDYSNLWTYDNNTLYLTIPDQS